MALGTLIVLFSVLFPPIARRMIAQDRNHAVVQWGMAEVVVKTEPQSRATGDMTQGEVVVRFRGSLHSARNISGLAELEVGRPAQIAYRVGRSGRVYIDLVQPLQAP